MCQSDTLLDSGFGPAYVKGGAIEGYSNKQKVCRKCCYYKERDPLAQWILKSESRGGQRQDGKWASVLEPTQIANLQLPRALHQAKESEAGQQRAEFN